MRTIRWRRAVTRVHAWLALIAGLQVVVWIVSGAVMSAMPIESVRGAHLASDALPPPLLSHGVVLPVDALLAAHPSATDVVLRTVAGRAVYEVTAPDGRALFDAKDGAALSPLSEELARAVAREAVNLAEPARDAALLTEAAPIDYRGALPVWRIAFADPESTVVYVSADTARTVARRTAQWRIYDTFWMLHTMDYRGRDDFNHPLIWAFAAAGVVLAASGAWLLWFSFRPRAKSGGR